MRVVFLKEDLERKRSDGTEMALMIIHELPVKNGSLSIRQTQVEAFRGIEKLASNVNIQLQEVKCVTLSQGGQPSLAVHLKHIRERGSRLAVLHPQKLGQLQRNQVGDVLQIKTNPHHPDPL